MYGRSSAVKDLGRGLFDCLGTAGPLHRTTCLYSDSVHGSSHCFRQHICRWSKGDGLTFHCASAVVSRVVSLPPRGVVANCPQILLMDRTLVNYIVPGLFLATFKKLRLKTII